MKAFAVEERKNVALSAAIQTLRKTMNRLDTVSGGFSARKGEVKVLRECAAIIARYTEDEIDLALQGFRPPLPH